MGEKLLFFGLLIFMGHLFLQVFRKTLIPDVLLLMLLGISVGPLGLNYIASADIGKTGPIMASLALALILFDGGTHLDKKTLNRQVLGSVTLILTTFFLSTLAAACLSFILIKSWLWSFYLGIAVSSISPAVIIPMLRSLPMSDEAKSVMVLEAALTDVICIVLAYAILNADVNGVINFADVTIKLLYSLGLSTVLGLVAGALWSYLLGHLRQFPNSGTASLAFLTILFGMAEVIHLSGLLAVLAFSIFLTNAPRILPIIYPRMVTSNIKLWEFSENELSLFSEIGFLLKVFFFFYLGISFQAVEYSSLLLAFLITALIYSIRIIVTKFTFHSNFTRFDATFVSQLVPKGLAAAVLAAIPFQRGIAEGEKIQNLAFEIVFFSILLTSVLIPMANRGMLENMYSRVFSSFRKPDL